MGRRFNPDLTMRWKVVLPAALAGKVEYMLLSPHLQKPIYGARGSLISALLEYWVARESGASELPHIPSVEELRSQNHD
jgi:hypothetical protein